MTQQMGNVERFPSLAAAALNLGTERVVRLARPGKRPQGILEFSVLLAEGADSILAPGSVGSDINSRAQLDTLLCEWADIALRTLVFAKRELPDFEAGCRERRTRPVTRSCRTAGGRAGATAGSSRLPPA